MSADFIVHLSVGAVMGIVHQQRQLRSVTIDAKPNDPDPVTQRVTVLEAELRSVTSLIAELASRVTSLRYRERKKHGVDPER
jgi:hypothetical protein